MNLTYKKVRCYELAWSKLAIALFLLLVLSPQLHAADPARRAVIKSLVAPSQPAVVSRYQLTLKQLGARYPIALRGVDGRDGVRFNVRADEVVTQAQLKIIFSYSPAMLPETSHINVLVNGEVVSSLELPKMKSAGEVLRVVDLPPKYITEYNKIDFQLIGHYTNQCEDPAHSSLWASISNMSTLEMTSEPVTLDNDLKNLPLPFMDQRDPRQLRLPVVLVGSIDNDMLAAAGTVASWFGAQAGQRGATFPSLVNTLPAKGHAIVMVAANAALPEIEFPDAKGPTLSIVSNPNDRDGKLLVINAQDSKGLRMAVKALTTATAALQGRSMLVLPAITVAARKPYDAPNWLASDRQVAFSEFSNATAMNVTGHNPGAIRLNMRLPPDLFQWNDAGVPISLKYRYTPQVLKSADSSLLVNFNEQLVRSIPLLPVGRMQGLMGQVMPDNSMSIQTRINVPMYMLAHQSQLQLNFKYDYSKEGECRDIIVDNMRGAIEPESWINISDYPHYLAMPNLGVFGSSGFPFTRMADLSETAVVLPDAPSAQEYTTYLDLMGRLGASTGYPATALSIVRAGQLAEVAYKDLLLIATGDNQTLLETWRPYMGVKTDRQTGWKFFGFDWNPLHWLLPSATAAMPLSVAALFDGASARARVIGFESPLSLGRSVVLLWGAHSDDLNDIVAALSDRDGLDSPIKGAMSVIRGTTVESQVTDAVYYAGSLPWITYIRWQLSQNFALFIVFSLASALLLATLLFYALKRMAAKRLA